MWGLKARSGAPEGCSCIACLLGNLAVNPGARVLNGGCCQKTVLYYWKFLLKNDYKYVISFGNDLSKPSQCQSDCRMFSDLAGFCYGLRIMLLCSPIFLCSDWPHWLTTPYIALFVSLIVHLERTCCKEKVLLESNTGKPCFVFFDFVSLKNLLSYCTFSTPAAVSLAKYKCNGVLNTLITCLLCLCYSGCEIWAISWQRISQISAETWFESKYFKIQPTCAKGTGIIKTFRQEVRADCSIFLYL